MLRSLTEGGEPLATSEEYEQWVRAWVATHPRRRVPLLDDAVPRPLRRYQALLFVHAFPWETWLRMVRVAHEVVDADPGVDTAGAPTAPLDEAAVRAEWLRWRAETIRRYRLGGLVAEEGQRELRSPLVPPFGS